MIDQDVQLIWEAYLEESVTSELIHLKKYLSLSDEEKQEDIAYEVPWMVDDFLNMEHPDILDHLDGVEEDYEKVDWLRENHIGILREYGQYVIDNQDDSFPTDLPSWIFFDGDSKIIRNEWLVHFTDEPYEILRQGFTIGVEDISKLGLTTYLPDIDKIFGGYNFAYHVNDFDRYGKNRHGRSWKYGSDVILLQGSGVKTWHRGDEEPQVIFYGKFAKNLIHIKESDGEYYVESVINHNTLFRNDDLETVVFWIIRNFDQYRKHLVSREKIQ